MSRFVRNHSWDEEFVRELGYSERLSAQIRVAVPFVEQAISSAQGPWMPRKGHAVVEVVEEEGHLFIVNTDYAAHLIEWGSVNNPPFAPLRRGAAAAGFGIGETAS